MEFNQIIERLRPQMIVLEKLQRKMLPLIIALSEFQKNMSPQIQQGIAACDSWIKTNPQLFENIRKINRNLWANLRFGEYYCQRRELFSGKYIARIVSFDADILNQVQDDNSWGSVFICKKKNCPFRDSSL